MDFIDFRCPCPNDAALVAIPESNCTYTTGQIVKMAFVKRGQVVWATDDGSSSGTGGVPVTNMDLLTQAFWTAQKQATDDTRIVVTPMLGSSVIAPGEPQYFGSGNEVPMGVPIAVGTTPATYTGNFLGIAPEQEKALRQLLCHELEVYFFNNFGEIIYRKTEDGKVTGFDVYNVVTGSRANNGHLTIDPNAFTFTLLDTWSMDMAKAKPATWNPVVL